MSGVIEVEVTQEDISRGKRGNCWCCPVAYAIHRLYSHWPDRTVRVSGTWITTPIGVYETPEVVANFVANFDTFHEVKPFKFILAGASK